MSAFTARMRKTVLLIAAATVLAACASGPEIRRDVNPSADFASYKTFGYFSELATDRAGYETTFTSRLKAATRRNLEAKGYTFADSSPDLLVNFYANVEDKQEIRSTPTSVGFYGYRGFYGYGMSTPDIQTVNYKEGTLTIDVVDTAAKTLVWNATAEGRVSKEARKNPGPAIDAIVDELMRPMPGRSGM